MTTISLLSSGLLWMVALSCGPTKNEATRDHTEDSTTASTNASTLVPTRSTELPKASANGTAATTAVHAPMPRPATSGTALVSTRSAREHCSHELLGKPEFMECKAHPSQKDYPECWTYTLAPVSSSPVSGSPVSGSPVSGSPVSGSPVSGSTASGNSEPSASCLVGELELTISGYSSRLDVLRVRGTRARDPLRFELRLVSVTSSILGFAAQPGALLATLSAEAITGRKEGDTGGSQHAPMQPRLQLTEMTFGPGMRSSASKTKLRCQTSKPGGCELR
jgi:hypothetical protein